MITNKGYFSNNVGLDLNQGGKLEIRESKRYSLGIFVSLKSTSPLRIFAPLNCNIARYYIPWTKYIIYIRANIYRRYNNFMTET